MPLCVGLQKASQSCRGLGGFFAPEGFGVEGEEKNRVVRGKRRACVSFRVGWHFLGAQHQDQVRRQAQPVLIARLKVFILIGFVGDAGAAGYFDGVGRKAVASGETRRGEAQDGGHPRLLSFEGRPPDKRQRPSDIEFEARGLGRSHKAPAQRTGKGEEFFQVVWRKFDVLRGTRGELSFFRWPG